MSAKQQFDFLSYDMEPAVGDFVGKAYIFNHKTFTIRKNQTVALNKREGTDTDVKRLEELFRLMKLDTEVCQDYTGDQFRKKLTAVEGEIKAEHKCVVVAILTHGSGHHIELKDENFELTKVFEGFDFTALRGKPKIFFVQACRGDKYNVVLSKSSTDAGKESTISNDGIMTSTPQGSDILACYSTSKGFFSFRHPQNGSWFIKKLCEVMVNYLSGNYEDVDLLSLITSVNNQVAERALPGKMNPPETNRVTVDLKQMPTFVSSLRRQIVFPSVEAYAQSDNFQE